MLDTIWATTSLFAKPDIDFCIKAYERRLKTIMSYQYNTEVSPPMCIYEKIISIKTKIENLQFLKNGLLSAFSLLKDSHKGVIKGVYFEGLGKDEVIKKLGITNSEYKYFKREGVKKTAFYLNMFGLTNERFVNLFNEEPLIVRNYQECLIFSNKTMHLRRRANGEF